jgi:hypothetical protein
MTEEKIIFTVDPHGAFMVREVEDDDHHVLPNRLFEVKERYINNPLRLLLTGEELTCLANQWLAYVEKETNDTNEVVS